jgi:hypothetical protein
VKKRTRKKHTLVLDIELNTKIDNTVIFGRLSNLNAKLQLLLHDNSGDLEERSSYF